MPKLLEYPKASIKKSLELTQTVHDLGGSCSLGMCADKLGKKVSGGFREIIHSAVKYGFLVQKKGILTTTPLFKDITLAYTPEEKNHLLQKSFLNVPLFHKVYERFKGKKLPIEIFDKLLIKEFGVSDYFASRVTKYFADGARTVGLMNPDFAIVSLEEIGAEQTEGDYDVAKSETFVENLQNEKVSLSGSYSVRIFGPGINSNITIMDQDDLEIVTTMLNKVRKKLGTIEKESDPDILK